MSSRLFEPSAVTRRGPASRELVPVESSRCPACGSTLEQITMEEPTLFRHGGHGATRRTISDHCAGDRPSPIPDHPCRWSIVRSVQEIRPR